LHGQQSFDERGGILEREGRYGILVLGVHVVMT
jgi:hypothetical protein